MHFFDILVVFRLALGQISFNLVENAFATRQLALLVTRIEFFDFSARECAEIKIFALESDPRLQAFQFLNFVCLSFFSFSFLFAAVIDLLLVLLEVKKLPRTGRKFCCEFFTQLF